MALLAIGLALTVAVLLFTLWLAPLQPFTPFLFSRFP